MPITATTEDGTEVELPVDKVEDIKTLTENAVKVTALEAEKAQFIKDLEAAKAAEHPDWPIARQKISKLEEALKTKDTEIATLKTGAHGAIDETKVADIATQKAKEEVGSAEAKRVEKERARLVSELSGGDESKKKVIEEKWKLIAGDRSVTDMDEMKSLLSDAHHLATKTRGGAGGAFDGVNAGGGGGGGPARTPGKANLERGANLAQAMGYRPKTDVNKIINR